MPADPEVGRLVLVLYLTFISETLDRAIWGLRNLDRWSDKVDVREAIVRACFPDFGGEGPDIGIFSVCWPGEGGVECLPGTGRLRRAVERIARTHEFPASALGAVSLCTLFSRIHMMSGDVSAGRVEHAVLLSQVHFPLVLCERRDFDKLREALLSGYRRMRAAITAQRLAFLRRVWAEPREVLRELRGLAVLGAGERWDELRDGALSEGEELSSLISEVLDADIPSLAILARDGREEAVISPFDGIALVREDGTLAFFDPVDIATLEKGGLMLAIPELEFLAGAEGADVWSVIASSYSGSLDIVVQGNPLLGDFSYYLYGLLNACWKSFLREGARAFLVLLGRMRDEIFDRAERVPVLSGLVSLLDGSERTRGRRGGEVALRLEERYSSLAEAVRRAESLLRSGRSFDASPVALSILSAAGTGVVTVPKLAAATIVASHLARSSSGVSLGILARKWWSVLRGVFRSFGVASFSVRERGRRGSLRVLCVVGNPLNLRSYEVEPDKVGGNLVRFGLLFGALRPKARSSPPGKPLTARGLLVSCDPLTGTAIFEAVRRRALRGKMPIPDYGSEGAFRFSGFSIFRTR